MSDDRDLDLEKYVVWMSEGKSFSDVRKDLELKGFSEAEVKVAILAIDDLLLQEAVKNEGNVQARQLRLASTIALIVGLGFIASFLVVHSFIVLAMGAALLGSVVVARMLERRIGRGRTSMSSRSGRKRFNMKRNRA